MSAQAFVAAARGLKGAKWRHQGRKPWAVDCIGLIVLAGKNAGVDFGDEKGYGREPWDDRLRKGCRQRWGTPVHVSLARAGDVAIIRWRKEEPSHLGIVADHPEGGLSLIHAHNIHGVIEQRIADRVQSSIVEVYRPWRNDVA